MLKKTEVGCASGWKEQRDTSWNTEDINTADIKQLEQNTNKLNNKNWQDNHCESARR